MNKAGKVKGVLEVLLVIRLILNLAKSGRFSSFEKGG
jgi:hypothetical protein